MDKQTVESLVPYLNKQLEEGFSLVQIRSTLIAHGYTQEDVNTAIDVLYGKPIVKPKHHLAFLVVVLVVGGAFIAGLVAFFSLSGPSLPNQLLDVELTLLSEEVLAGEEVLFNVELTNLGAAGRYDVFLNHELLSSSGELVTSSEESIAVQTRAAKASRLRIPQSLDTGRYKIRTTARYDGQEALASADVEIHGVGEAKQEPPPVIEPEPVLEPTLEPEPEKVQQEPTSQAQVEAEELVGEIKGVFFTIEDIKEIASQDLSKARLLCENSFQEQLRKDVCLLEVGVDAKRSVFCSNIQDEGKRDNCYMSVALSNDDYTLCDRITNEKLKASCEVLGT